jgi:hypothetical protein
VDQGMRVFADHSYRFDRPDLLLPEVIIEPGETDIPTTMRPILDSFWQSAGSTECLDYDSDGHWKKT